MTSDEKEQIKESYGYVIYDPETNAYYCAPGYWIWHDDIAKAHIYSSIDNVNKSEKKKEGCEIIKVKVSVEEVVE